MSVMEAGQEVGDWKCLRILGRGSFGLVGLWKDTRTGVMTAVKQFDSRAAGTESPESAQVLVEMEGRWEKEVEMMYKVVRSPHVVSTFPVPKDLLRLTANANPTRPAKPLPLLCMEYCSGGDLRQLLRRPENISGLRERDARAVLSHVEQAISYLHDRQIVHRDLKPENILVQYQPIHGSMNRMETIYKLSDLGFAKNLSNSESFCSTVVGTLQYLAPEIYMGKNYDKTVDFWSFGLIAFEISCGMRPFLHGESPARWYPYVEEKARNTVAIYRSEDGTVEHSSSIPYNTHLSELFKKCFETWLRMMLQFEPSRRGRKVLTTAAAPKESGPTDFQPVVGLSVLRNILQTQMLSIHCPSRRLAFAIGRSTTIRDIQNLIQRDLAVELEDQLILTADGTRLLPHEHALKFFDGVGLFMVPKTSGSLNLKLKIPKCVNKFLTSWETVRDPLVLRKVWISVVFFVKTEVEQMEMLKKASTALTKWERGVVGGELKGLKVEVEKALASLEKILEFERDLEAIDEKLAGSKGTGEWGLEQERLQTQYQKTLEEWQEDIVTSPVSISEIEEIYHKILKTYEDWREASGTVHIENLVRSLCLFVAQRDPVVEALGKNIRSVVEQLVLDEKTREGLRGIESSLHDLMRKLMESRCEKQRMLLDRVFGGKDSPLRNGGEVLCPVPDRMSQSETLTSRTRTRPTTDFSQVSTMSLDRADRDNVEISTELANLMEQSQILDLETEDTLTNALQQAREILTEKEKMDWEFLG